METTMLYLILVVGLAGVALLVLVGIPQYKIQMREKQKVALQIEKYSHIVSRYRLSKMLSFLGIRLHDYLTRIPHDAIEKHITNCDACPNIPLCDRCLRDNQYVNDMNFCPNYQSLMAFSRIMPSVE